MRHLLPTLLALVPAVAAQAPALDGTYTLAQLSARDGSGTCGPGPVVGCDDALGVLALAPTGTFTVTLDQAEHCPSGGPPVLTSDTVSGTYVVDHGGLVVLDLNPAAPGVELVELEFAWDRQWFLGRFGDPGEPRIVVGVRRGSGLSTASLAGTYDHVTLTQGFAGGELWTEASGGPLTFAGTGAWSAVEAWRAVGVAGTTAGLRSASGTVLVAADGTLRLDGAAVARGALTPDGRFGFWLGPVGAPGRLRLFARRASAPVTPTALDDDWWLTSYGGRRDVGTSHVKELTGKVVFDATAGTFAFTGTEVEVGTGGPTQQTGGTSGTVTLLPDGRASVAGSGPAILGRLGGGEDVALFLNTSDPDQASVAVFLRDWGPLEGDVEELSVSAGGAQTLALRAGREHAGRAYWILGSRTGSHPPTPVGGALVPLVPDAYTLTTVTGANVPPLFGTLGTLDADGAATASIVLPAGAYLAGAGSTLLHAALVLIPPGLADVRLASNAEPLRLLP